MADSEVRQKFEATELLELAWASYEERLDGPEAAWKAFRFAFSAGMRAGEIAQREFVIDLLGKRITRILEIGREDKAEGYEDYGQSHCFHLMEIQRILRGEKTCGVYDDYGALPISGAEESKK